MTRMSPTIGSSASGASAGGHPRLEPSDAFQHIGVAKQVEAGQRDGAGEWVRRERMAVEEGLRAISPRNASNMCSVVDRRAERQVAGRQRLRQADDVGGDRGVLAREHPAGAAESREHLVGDEQRSVSIAEASRAGQKFARPDDHPAGRLQHRLDEDGGDGVAVALERRFEAAQAVDLAASPARDRAGSDSSRADRRASPETAAARTPA